MLRPVGPVLLGASLLAFLAIGLLVDGVFSEYDGKVEYRKSWLEPVSGQRRVVGIRLSDGRLHELSVSRRVFEEIRQGARMSKSAGSFRSSIDGLPRIQIRATLSTLAMFLVLLLPVSLTARFMAGRRSGAPADPGQTARTDKTVRRPNLLLLAIPVYAGLLVWAAAVLVLSVRSVAEIAPGETVSCTMIPGSGRLKAQTRVLRKPSTSRVMRRT
jgi:hypothetical protein